jgi:hypothetical protein
MISSMLPEWIDPSRPFSPREVGYTHYALGEKPRVPAGKGELFDRQSVMLEILFRLRVLQYEYQQIFALHGIGINRVECDKLMEDKRSIGILDSGDSGVWHTRYPIAS